jgi:hypothetical protein
MKMPTESPASTPSSSSTSAMRLTRAYMSSSDSTWLERVPVNGLEWCTMWRDRLASSLPGVAARVRRVRSAGALSLVSVPGSMTDGSSKRSIVTRGSRKSTRNEQPRTPSPATVLLLPRLVGPYCLSGAVSRGKGQTVFACASACCPPVPSLVCISCMELLDNGHVRCPSIISRCIHRNPTSTGRVVVYPEVVWELQRGWLPWTDANTCNDNTRTLSLTSETHARRASPPYQRRQS